MFGADGTDVRFVTHAGVSDALADPRAHIWVSRWTLVASEFFWVNAAMAHAWVRTVWSPSMVLTRTILPSDDLPGLLNENRFLLIAKNDQRDGLAEIVGRTLHRQAAQRRRQRPLYIS